MEITSQRKIERTSPNYFRSGDPKIVGGLKQGAFVCPVLIMASFSPPADGTHVGPVCFDSLPNRSYHCCPQISI